MALNVVLSPGMTVGALCGDNHDGQWSSRFSREIHATCAYVAGGFSSQQDHLEAVVSAADSECTVYDAIYREMNPAQLIRIAEVVGCPEKQVEQAYECGKKSYQRALSDGFGCSAACAKACVAIRTAIL